jgi:Tfp pilus assembly protein PilN
MLRTNLATRPFYNQRVAGLLVAALVVVVAAITVINVGALMRLTGQHVALRAEATEHEKRSVELRRKAQQARTAIDPVRLKSVADAAHEANAVIDRRTFSWTELFNRFEDTLPPDVRITAVRPTRDDRGRFFVTVSVESHEVDDIDEFMEALESRGGFRDVLARREQIDDEGLIEASISGLYMPPASTAAATAGETR